MGRRTATSEGGFTLAGLIVILTVMMIFIAYTVPRQWSNVMRRERERQTIYAMKQYARAIREYTRNHGNVRPVSMDQLKEAKLPRYVRGPKAEIIDPLTGKFDWILIPPGAVGGAPLAGSGSGPDGRSPNPNGAAPQKSGFNPAASPKDYVGDFIGVRPPVTGPSMIKFNGAEQYDQWFYTITELDIDIKARTTYNPNAK